MLGDFCLMFDVVLTDLLSCFFLMIRRPPRSTRTDTLFPYTTLFRSVVRQVLRDGARGGLRQTGDQREQRGLPATARPHDRDGLPRSEEHTSELQSLMRISYAVFCLKKKKRNRKQPQNDTITYINSTITTNKQTHT